MRYHVPDDGRVARRRHRILLSKRINEIPLSIKGSNLETHINQLYREMKDVGISFKPKTYLTDEWGCPNRVPVIGVPFYLADERLLRLQCQITGAESKDEAETMMVLRHEAGHAFNYAYRLYRTQEWRRIFGLFSRPYKDDYKPVPFSLRFIHNTPGWYAQKHPDDDFAETFAVWLTPGSEWQRRYNDTPALVKLSYVDKTVHKYGQKPPVVADGKLDMPVQEMTMTLREWYERRSHTARIVPMLHNALNNDILRLFPARRGSSAAELLRSNQEILVRGVNHWTGVDRALLRALVDELVARVKFLGLKIEPEQASARVVSTSAFITTLVMNHLCRGRFVET